jgi:hypothetical protein
MTKPLLITAGCSWTDALEPGYTENGINVWSSIAAEFMEWDLANCGDGGAGNQFISNRVFDAINENPDREIVVFVYWSQACRGSIFGLDHFVLGKTDNWTRNPTDRITKIEVQNQIMKRLHVISKKHITHKPPTAIPGLDQEMNIYAVTVLESLRAICVLDEYCKMKGITIIHGAALNAVMGSEAVTDIDVEEHDVMSSRRIKLREELFEVCKDLKYYQYIENMTNKIERNFFDYRESGYHKYEYMFISRKDPHPNQKAHKLIAAEFINAYHRELNKDRPASEQSYVYD